MNKKQNSIERQSKQDLSSGSLPDSTTKNAKNTINKDAYGRINNRENISERYQRFDSSIRNNHAGSQYQNTSNNVKEYNPEYFQRQANKEYDNFLKFYEEFLNFTEPKFDSCWRKGMTILKGHASKEKKDKTGWLLLKLINYSPENFDRYESEIPSILELVSIDVRTWYFFEISKYYFQFFSNKISDKAFKLLTRVWEEGIFFLGSDVVQKKTVKSDVAEQLLLILDSSNPELLKKSKIDVQKQINVIGKYIIHDDLETTKQVDYGFAFQKERFGSTIIRTRHMTDHSKEILKKYSINNISLRKGFKIFNITVFLSLLFFSISIYIWILF